ncbi:MAG: glycoside hydrolase family 3 [Roseburia sp.]|nr:glycoside hydrolase family 3 [Roseburia sp.]MCM1098120.1 glycoside hydrolase family 3 [Ruminococcus flavefaciens]
MKRTRKKAKSNVIATLTAAAAVILVFAAVGMSWQALRGEDGGGETAAPGTEAGIESKGGAVPGADGSDSAQESGDAETGIETGSSSAQGGGDAASGTGSGDGGDPGAEPGAGSESSNTQESVGSNVGGSPEAEAVEALLAEMTLEEKVYQLFVVYPSAITGVRKVTAAGEKTRQGLEKYPVGGLIYDKSNMVSKEQVREMLEKVQTYTRIPLILTCDEEGGRVSRLMSTVGTTQVGPMFEYREEGTSVARENAGIIAGDLVSLGFNMDLAPVADVWSNPENKVIGDRAYSDDFGQAAELVAAAVEGFREGGVACTLKHFPGHGDTSADSHYGSVYVYKTLDELRAQELLSFQAGIDAGADAVMMGHLIIVDVEEEPALFSYRLVTELLREEMGFQGVVITDGLQMEAMTDYYSSGEIAVKAVQAGVDMLLCPRDLEEAAEALLQAVETGEISEERLDESVRRILTLKKERGIL